MHLDALLADLASAPHLSGAACRDHAELFDRTIGSYSLAPTADTNRARRAAQAICAACPALDACRTWLESMPAQRRPYGVTAGIVVPWAGHPARAA